MSRPQFSNARGVHAAMRRAMVNLVPPADLLPSAWAEENVRIPVGNAIPGPISFDNAPYQRGMVDVIKERGVTRVSYMTGAQLGKTTIQQVIAGYFIAHEPRSQIFVQPTQGDVQTFLETKLRPMLEANPKISSRMAKARGREGVNNSRIISYIGGWLMFSWAGSPKTLRGRSAPVTQADEIDGMDTTPEGDPVQLLAQRGATFGDQRLLVESSTPTVKGSSRIETGYQEGDQRRYFVPCPHCDHSQYFRWPNVRWTGRKSTDTSDTADDLGQEHQPDTAAYSCEACGALWNDGERIAAVRRGEWRATKPFKGHASFHLPELASPFRRLRDIVQSYLDKLAVGDVQSFVNVSLAETFEEQGEQADANSLMARAEEYRAPVPAGGLVLTVGVDMQPDRLELEIVAWGHGEESWSVDYIVLWGDVLAGDVWDELEEILSSTWLHESGAQLPIMAACVDTGGTGGATQAAYEWLRGKTGRRIFGTKGVAGWGRPIVAAPSRKQSGKTARKIDLFLLGADEAKLTVMRRLSVPKPGPGFCHFPTDRGADWYNQLTAEKLITRTVKGFPVREWHQTRPRNEALDCRALATAALKIANPSFKRAAQRLGMPVMPPWMVKQQVEPEAAPAADQAPDGHEEWAKRTAAGALALADVLHKLRDAANPEKPEIPQEDGGQKVRDTARIKRSQSLKANRGKGWVNNWR